MSEVKQATVTLEIENRYEFYADETTIRKTVVPLPVPDAGTDERRDWAYDHIFPETGVGHTDGSSWYDVTIIKSDVPELVGMQFEFGY